jgi:nitroreductase
VDVLKAITSRFSTRAFTAQPVDLALVQQLLDAARFAPSGVNHQPWRVAVLTGNTKKTLSQRIIAARHAGVNQHPDYHYYPDEFREPYLGRRKACGIALYHALGIQREDLEKRKQVWELNYQFFGAPVGLIFSLDADLVTGSWLDIGMFLQNVMLGALDLGLSTCPQAALAEYPDIVREVLNIPETQSIVCGMALGYADLTHPINQYRTTREPVENFTHFYS